MTKSCSARRIACDATTSDLRSLVHFCAESGQIWLHEHRMLLVHANAQGGMRKELIDSLGMERARGLLIRMEFCIGHARCGSLQQAGSGVDRLRSFHDRHAASYP